MRTYEGIFVFPPTLSQDEKKGEEKKLEELIQRNEGKIVQKVDWGKRALGYRVKKFREGYLLYLDIQMKPARVIDFRKTVQLAPEIIKFMLTVKNPKAGHVPAAKTTPQKVAASAGTTKKEGV